MIKIPTVFVVGAGASVDYEFPPGPRLVRDIVQGLSDENAELRRWLEEVGFAAGDLSAFGRRLERSGLRSIDAFLESNPTHAEIGKASICASILLAESACLRIDRLFGKPPEDHWLGYVWNRMHPGSSVAELPNSKVAFVSFNYDRVIEHYLDTVLENTFGIEASAASQLRAASVPIVHLHGHVGDVPFGGATAARSLLRQIAADIKVIHDNVEDADAEFKRAHSLLSDAQQVCFIGFGYDAVNVRRLKIRDLVLQRQVRVHGTSYGLQGAERETVKEVLGYPISGANYLKIEAFLRQEVSLK